MCSRCPDRASGAGFSLTEVLITIATLVVILILSAQLLFATRRSSERQKLQVEARQNARAAVEYVSYSLRSASDLNYLSDVRNPLAVVTWMWRQSGGGPAPDPIPGCPGDAGCVQAAFNNYDGSVANLADAGTDIVTIARPDDTRVYPIDTWPGFPSAANVRWSFGEGCPPPAGTDADANMELFKATTGYDPATGMSGPLVVVDGSGTSFMYQITSYQQSYCEWTAPDPSPHCQLGMPCVHVTCNPGLSGHLNPPGGQRDHMTWPVNLLGGLRFLSYRVCNGWLQEKEGVFDPAADNTCTAGSTTFDDPPWRNLLPNVEDLQIAYTFRNGQTCNTAAGAGTTCAAQMGSPIPLTGQVPGMGIGGEWDATNVIGFRVLVTARSVSEVPVEKMATARPAGFDRPAAPAADGFYHFQISADALIRNRVPAM